MVTYVYALVDPRTDQVRYVGKTRNLNRRLIAHITDARCRRTTYKKCRWIQGLLKLSLRPRLEVLQEVEGTGCAEEREHIARLRIAGAKLLNMTEGGEHHGGHSPETIERLRTVHQLSSSLARIT